MAKKEPQQTALFGVTPTEEDMQTAVVLYEPDPARLSTVTEDLKTTFNKNDVYKLAQVFHPMLKNKLLVLQKPDGQRVPANDVLPLFSMASNKESLSRALAYILADQRNIQPYVDTLSEEMRNFWRHMLINIFCTEDEAKQILNTTNALFNRPRYSYYYEEVNWNRRGFDFFNIARSLSAKKERWGYRTDDYFIRIKSYVQGLFYPIFYPETFGDPTVYELPDKYQCVTLENECFLKFNLLSSLIQTDKIGQTAKGLSQADVKRATKQLGMDERFVYFYTTSIALTHHFIKKRNQKKTDYPATLRILMDNLSAIRYFLPSLLLPHIKGLRKPMIDLNHITDLCTFMLEWLKNEPERWSPIEAIFIKIYACNVGTDFLQRCVMVFPPEEQKSNTEIINEFSGRHIDISSFVREFGLTTIQSFAYMLCGLGMAEIALSPLKRDISPFAQADFIRLTPLGRYALGIDDDYEAPQQEEIAYFELDPDRLIIRSLANPNPYAQLLLDTSVAISRNRFETSAESFLAHCYTQHDVEEKIGIFKQFVSHELPPLWKRFFDSLLLHCNPLQSDYTNYQQYRIDPKNTELIQLLTTDPKLRQMVTRAEGYLLLVKKDDLKKFTDELKKHGYLL